MAWYKKYLNKITKNDNFWLNLETEMLYEGYSKCVHPKGTNSVRWYEFYLDPKTSKKIRVTEKMKRFRKFKYVSRREVKEKYPEVLLFEDL